MNESVFGALEKIFHEPNRLAIMSAVCAADAGVTFGELKETCGLTDGNLNRHLKVLVDAGAVTVSKEFVDNKPRTTITMTKEGLQRFSEYLGALSAVLEKAREALQEEKKESVSVLLGQMAKGHA